MIRAADDFDAIHAAVQQLRGRPAGASSEVDLYWYYNLSGDEYYYKLVSERAKSSAFSDCTADDNGFIGLSWKPDELRRALKNFEDYVLEEVPAP